MAAAGGRQTASLAWGAHLAGAWVALAACSHAGPEASADAGVPSGTVVPLPAERTVPPCGPGYVHPSVCCEPAPYQSPECVENLGAPFQPCGRWLTFPDPQACCSLDDGSQCMAPAQTTASGSTVQCELPCGPGGFLPDDPVENPDGGWVNCANYSTGFCVACCYGRFSEPGSYPTPVTTVGCSEDPFLQGGPALCSSGACPAGWQVPRGGQFNVCLQRRC